MWHLILESTKHFRFLQKVTMVTSRLVCYLTLLLLVFYTNATFNLKNIVTVFETNQSALAGNGRILTDNERSRVIITASNYVYFVDTNTRKSITSHLPSYSSLSGEFVDEDGVYHAFGNTLLKLTMVSILPSGTIMSRPVTAINSISCAVKVPGVQRLYVSTSDFTSNSVALYDYGNDTVLASVKTEESGSHLCTSQ